MTHLVDISYQSLGRWAFPDEFPEKLHQIPKECFQGSMRDQLSALDEIVSYLELYGDLTDKRVTVEELDEAIEWYRKNSPWKDSQQSVMV